MASEQDLERLKVLIILTYDDINSRVADFEDTEVRAHLLRAINIVDELVSINELTPKIRHLIDIVATELRISIGHIYSEANDMIVDFEDTKARAHLLNALAIANRYMLSAFRIIENLK